MVFNVNVTIMCMLHFAIVSLFDGIIFDCAFYLSYYDIAAKKNQFLTASTSSSRGDQLASLLLLFHKLVLCLQYFNLQVLSCAALVHLAFLCRRNLIMFASGVSALFLLLLFNRDFLLNLMLVLFLCCQL